MVRDEAKYHRLVAFCAALPGLRAAVERDLACACLCKRKVVATVVALMERAQLRVGNDEYARQNGSYGATTLRDRHAKIPGDTLELAYRGTSGAAATSRASACSSIAMATRSARSARTTSTTTCARSPAARSPRRTIGPGRQRWARRCCSAHSSIPAASPAASGA